MARWIVPGCFEPASMESYMVTVANIRKKSSKLAEWRDRSVVDLIYERESASANQQAGRILASERK